MKPGMIVGRFLILALLAPAVTGASAAGRWYTYANCRLIDNPANDGDSFHVKTKSDEFIFRLYFVDTPECDLTFPDRVKEQADYWHIGTNEVLALGREAATFTREFLGKEFTVYSKREDARGQSKMERFYAIVKAGDRSLAEALVEKGLARVYGMATDLPDDTAADTYFASLRSIERAARKKSVGGWRPAPARTFLAVKAQDRVIDRSLSVYAATEPARLVYTLKPGTTITIDGAVSATDLLIRYGLEGERREGLCRRKDLGL